MYPFECYTVEEAIGYETGFTGIQTQGYSKLPKNLQRKGNLIPKSKLESKMSSRQTAQIDEPSQRGKASLNSLMIHGAEETELVDQKAESFQKLTRSHNGGVAKLFKTSTT